MPLLFLKDVVEISGPVDVSPQLEA
jgi:hypothetical protein